MIALQADDAAQAMAWADRSLTQQNDFHAATLLKAQAQKEQGDVDAGLATVGKAIKRWPRETPLRLAQAQLLLQAERNDEAEAAYKRVLGVDPKQPEALFALGLLALDSNRLDAGRYYFGQLWETGLQPNAAAFYQGLVAEQSASDADDKASAQAFYAEALNWYHRVREGDQLLEAQHRIGQVMATSGDVEGALVHYADARQQLPDASVQFYLGEGQVLFDAGRYDQAHALYTAALVANPDNTDLRYARALAAEKIGELDQVESDLCRILEQRPDDPVVLNALGYTLADRTDRHQEALDLIERALELAPDKPFIIDSMGWVLFKLGQHQRALDYLQRAYELLRDPEVAAHLGEVLWVVGEQDRARAVLSEASAENPGLPGDVVRKVIERLTP